MQDKSITEDTIEKQRLARFFAAYALLPNASSASRQLSELARTIPFFLFFHLSAAVSINVMVFYIAPQLLLGLWQVCVLLTAALLVWAIYEGRRITYNAPNADTLLKASPLIGLILACVWIVPPLLFAKNATFGTSLGIFCVTFTVMAMGAISFVRLPAAAILFSVIMTVALAFGASITLETPTLLALFICSFFTLAVVGTIVAQHFAFLRHVTTENEMNRQSHVIKLLLNDFESNTSDWLWETDTNGKLVYFSPRLATVFGKAPDELLGRDFIALFDGQNTTAGEDSLVSIMASQKAVVDHSLETKKHGIQQYWQISARPLNDDQGQFSGYRGVGRDITNQINHDFQIQKAKEDAEKANAAKSQFLAVMSHELRTPINAIVGFSEVLYTNQGDGLPMSSKREYLTTILESARHLQGLINDILDATRIERGTLQLDDQQIDVAELVETAIRICRNLATRSNISVIAHVLDDVLIMGDLTRLKQVILNLVTNAIKFSPAGGVVNIDMRRGPEQQLVISIRDAGIGINDEDIERVFEPFAQVDEGTTRKYGGMGLGLAIARKIARLHGGDVTLNGEPGIGTEASLILPQARVRWPKPRAKSSTSVAA